MNWYFTVLQKYFVVSGRARRSEYWYFCLFNFIISIAFAVAGDIVKMPALQTIYSLAVIFPGIAVTVRRMHDVGKSGWYCLIPIYNLVLACKEGDKGENNYGSDPKENTLALNA